MVLLLTTDCSNISSAGLPCHFGVGDVPYKCMHASIIYRISPSGNGKIENTYNRHACITLPD